MSNSKDDKIIKRYFKGTQRQISNSNYLSTIEGTFHINPIPKKSIPELKSGKIDIKIVFPHAYPYESPQAFIKNEELWLFAHNRMDDGKVCPPDHHRWLKEPSIKAYLDYLNEFFLKAAQNCLELSDDYFELPHFPIGEKSHFSCLLFVEENPNVWIKAENSKIGTFLYTINGRILKIEGFDNDKKKNSGTYQNGIYVWLPAEPIVKYKRPPIYFYELNMVLGKYQLSLKNIIDEIYKLKFKRCCVIIGFPVREKNKDKPNDIHWQGFDFDISEFYRIWRRKRKKGKKKQTKHYEIAKDEFIVSINDEKVNYISSQNCSKRYLYSRIGVATKISNYIIFGCGAVGSHLAFQLARAGCDELSLCDFDIVEAGNICRHFLDFSSIRKSKAVELSSRLKKINPWGIYIPYCKDILSIPKESDDLRNFLGYDLWIDAGLPAKASCYLSDLAKQNGKRIISIYITNKAKYLIIVISGDKSKPSIEDVELYIQKILQKHGSVRFKECLRLLKNPERDVGIRPNTGCYFLTFEATGANISVISAIAYSIVNDLSEKNYKHGRGLVYYYDNIKFSYELILDENIS